MNATNENDEEFEIDIEDPAAEPASPPPPAADPPPEPDRARPGLRAAGPKVALLLLLVGLLPLAALPIALLPLQPSLEDLTPALAERATALRQAADDLAADWRRAEQARAAAATELAAAEHRRAHRRAIEARIRELTPLVAGQDPETVRQQAAAAEALAAGPFDQAVLVAIEQRAVVLPRAGEELAALDDALPELAAAYAPGRPPPAEPDGWSWRRLPGSGYLLAVRGSTRPAPQPAAAAAVSTAALDRSAEALQQAIERVDTFAGGLGATALALSLGLPVFALLLALIGWWWLRNQLLRPVRLLSHTARQALAAPRELEPPAPERTGLLADLAASLERIGQRLGRLEELDEQRAGERDQLRHLRAALERAGAGQLGVRLPDATGAITELTAAFNGLLDATVERIETLRRTSGQVAGAAERLRPVAEQLAERLDPETRPAATIEPGALGELVGAQLEGFCQAAERVAGTIQRDAPEALDNEALEAFRRAIQSTQQGFELLSDRIAEATRASDRLAELRQQVEVLSTNLAISAEAKSPAQMERLVEDARGLSRSVLDLSEGLSEALTGLENSGQQVGEAYRDSAVHFQQAARQLVQWEKLRRELVHHVDDLSHQRDLVRPGAAALGADLNRLATQLREDQRARQGVAATLSAAGEAAAALAATAAELLRELDRFDTGRPAPGSLTRQLARQQRELEQAITALTDLAADQGIESLSQDARRILDDIEQLAVGARQRLGTSDRDGGPPPADTAT